jgi:hypothetical protein
VNARGLKVTWIFSNRNGAARALKLWHTSRRARSVSVSALARKEFLTLSACQKRRKVVLVERTRLQTELFERYADDIPLAPSSVLSQVFSPLKC